LVPSSPNWDLLKKDIKDFYDADLDITRYKVKDLTAYVKKTKKAKMGTLSTWKKYARGFIRIGGWLKAQTKISETEHMVYFWEGIPRTMKKKIEERLLSKEPNRDMSKPFTVKEITELLRLSYSGIGSIISLEILKRKGYQMKVSHQMMNQTLNLLMIVMPNIGRGDPRKPRRLRS
jgi:hypothetical protein